MLTKTYHHTIKYYTRIFPHCQALYTNFTLKICFCGFNTTEKPAKHANEGKITKIRRQASSAAPNLERLLLMLSVNRCMIRIFGLDDLNVVVNVHTGACGDKLTDDNIFLKTEKMVALALDSSICKSTGRLPGRKLRTGSCRNWRKPL